MSRGKKLDLFIGSDLGDGWSEVRQKREAVAAEQYEPQRHRLVFRREKRRAKVVTLVGPFALDTTDAAVLLGRLKKKLGSGGSYKAPWMEFQGECEVRLRELLAKESFRFKH